MLEVIVDVFFKAFSRLIKFENVLNALHKVFSVDTNSTSTKKPIIIDDKREMLVGLRGTTRRKSLRKHKKNNVC